MDTALSAEQLALALNQWCDRHGVSPASGQAGERLTERNIRYYRTLGLVDAPAMGDGQGFGEKHRLQLMAVRLLQAQGLPLSRIRALLFGRSVPELRNIEKQGLAELEQGAQVATFHPATAEETWRVTPLDHEFLIVSRRGRGLPEDLCKRLRAVLHPKEEKTNGRSNGTRKEG